VQLPSGDHPMGANPHTSAAALTIDEAPHNPCSSNPASLPFAQWGRMKRLSIRTRRQLCRRLRCGACLPLRRRPASTMRDSQVPLGEIPMGRMTWGGRLGGEHRVQRDQSRRAPSGSGRSTDSDSGKSRRWPHRKWPGHPPPGVNPSDACFAKMLTVRVYIPSHSRESGQEER
jgi:hypothetical protein